MQFIEKITKNNNNLVKIVFLCVGLCLFADMISLSALDYSYPNVAHLFGRFHKIIRFVIIIICLIFCIKNTFDLRKLFLFLFFVLVIAISPKTWILFDILFIPLLFSEYLNRIRIYRITFFSIIICSTLIICLDFFNFFASYNFSRGEGVLRYNLGFMHPNALGYVVMLGVMLYSLIKKAISFLDCCIFLSVGVILYLVTKSRASSYIIMAFAFCSILSVIFQNISYNLRRYLYIFSVFLFIFIVAGLYFVVLSKIYQYDFFKNLFVGNIYSRLELADIGLREYGFSLFGQKFHTSIEWDLVNGGEFSNYFVLDSTYFYLPIAVGVIPTLLILYVLNSTLKQIIYEGNLRLYFVFILLIIYSVFDRFVFSGSLGLFLFMQSSYLYKYSKS